MTSKRQRAFELFDQGLTPSEVAEIISEEFGEANNKTLKNTVKTYRHQWKAERGANMQDYEEDTEEEEENSEDMNGTEDMMKRDILDALKDALPREEEVHQHNNGGKPVIFTPVEQNPIDSLKTPADVYKFVIEDAIRARYIPETQRDTLMTWLMIHEGNVDPTALYSRLQHMGGTAARMAGTIVETYNLLLNKIRSGESIKLPLMMSSPQTQQQQPLTFQQLPSTQQIQHEPLRQYQQYSQPVQPPYMPPHYPYQPPYPYMPPYVPNTSPQSNRPMTQEELVKMITELKEKEKQEQEISNIKMQMEAMKSEFTSVLNSIKDTIVQREHQREKEELRRQYEGIISSLDEKINKLQERIENPPMSKRELVDEIVKELTNKGMLANGPNPELLEIQRKFEKDKLDHILALKKLDIEEEGNKAMASLLELAPAIGAAAARKLAQSPPSPPPQSPPPQPQSQQPPQQPSPQSDEEVTMLTCPNCGEQIAVPNDAKEVTCGKCGGQFAVQR